MTGEDAMPLEADRPEPAVLVVRRECELPPGLDARRLAEFLSVHLRPYEDTVDDTERAVRYALDQAPNQGGAVFLALRDGALAGALLSLDLHMGGFVADHLWIYVVIHPDWRGRGLGGQLMRAGFEHCPGTVKAHVDFDNGHSRHLFAKHGFVEKYVEVRRTP